MLHCVYVRGYNCCISNDPNHNGKKVYECLNSWGFKEPIVIIPQDSPAIKGIWEVSVEVERAFNK